MQVFLAGLARTIFAGLTDLNLAGINLEELEAEAIHRRKRAETWRRWESLSSDGTNSES